jgi:hypothetical protein
MELKMLLQEHSTITIPFLLGGRRLNVTEFRKAKKPRAWRSFFNSLKKQL